MITSFFAPKKRKAAEESSNEEKSENRKDVVTTNGSTKFESLKRQKNGLTSSKPLSPDVEELMSTLTNSCWKEALQQHISKPSFTNLAAFVKKERANKTVYPPPADTFTALNLVPLDKVKVVIVGQDPYHGPGQGHGLAFSVKKGIKIPPSLRNIYKELLDNDCGLNSLPTHGFLERWAKQGVLMLNSVLTVRRGEAFSHKGKGWEEFTDEIIRCLFTKRSENAGGLVFLLWGKPASKKAESIINRHTGGFAGKSKVPTKVFCSSHPSPLGATKTNAPFIGSKCFTKANEALVEMNMIPIDWGVDGHINIGEESESIQAKADG